MAYVYRKTDQEDKTPVANVANSGGGQTLVSDTDSGSIGGDASSAPGTSSGSGWTNLQSYVDANKGEPERGAERIVSEVQGEREDTTQNVQDFGETAVSGYDKADDTFLDDLRQGRSNQPAREGQTLENLYGTGYGGPDNVTGVEGYDTTLGDVQDFGRTRDALTDPNKIVEQYTPGSSLGEKSLDRFFYQQKPAQEIFQREVDAGKSVDDLWKATTGNLDADIQADRAAYGTQQTNIQDAFNQGLSGFESQFDPNINQDFVTQKNVDRQNQYDALLGGAGRGGRVGDFESGFGDLIGYDWEKMFDYGGDTRLGDYVGDTGAIDDYRNFLAQYGGAFGAQDIFGGNQFQQSGNLGTNVAGTADATQKNALAELGALYNQGGAGQQGVDMDRWNHLLSVLGVQGFADPRPLPPQAAPPPPPPAPIPESTWTPESHPDPEGSILERVFGKNPEKKLDPRRW
jgi:hypothetical protein